MASTVNVGTLEGLLRWKADDVELQKSLTEVAQKANVSQKQVKQYNAELKSITSSYERVASSLDPVTANTLKYEKAERSLLAALKAGIVSQEHHNKLVAQAKEKYLSSSAPTLTWREEIQRLTTVMGPLGGRVSGLISSLDDVKAALLGSSAAATTASGSASAATSSFAALYAAAGPLIIALASLAAAAGLVFVAFKSFSFLKDAVSEGVQTQLIIERLDETLRATGATAQMSSAQMVALAESYELLSGKSKEQIISAEMVLARFESLNKNTYPRALELTLAYAKAMGVTAEQAANKLGPALEGNTRSLGALKDAGVVLSTAQKKTLQDMVEGGKVAEYQAHIFEILEGKVGTLSHEYDANLSRQGERARIVLQDFGESIANQVIPAIEDMVGELVKSLGGWDRLKKTVNEVGGAIGTFIRFSIYGLGIELFKLAENIETLVSKLAMAASKILAINAAIKGSYASLSASVKLVNVSKEADKAAQGHRETIARLAVAMANFKPALEGNTKVYQSNGSEIDRVIGKNAELSRLMEELTDIYQDQTLELERIYALRMLAASGPMSKETRLAEEKKINDTHKERILFLQQEAKFGTQIAESLAKQRKELKDLALKTNIELAVATKIDEINIDPKAIDKLFALSDESYKKAIANLESTIDIEQRNQDEFQRSREEYADRVQGVANDWKEHFKSMREVVDEEIGKVLVAVQEGAMTVAEGERAIAQIRADYYSAQIDQWSGFASSIAGMLSEIGGAFGSFMSQMAQVAGSIQNVNQTANSLGGWSTAMGAFGGTVAAFVELYKFADSVIQKHKGEKYGTRGGASITGGNVVSSYLTQGGMEITRAISDVLKAFEDQLRVSVTDLQAIEIRVRNNGTAVQAWVKGEWIGTFSDVNTAIREALMVAMQDPSSSLRGLSDLMVEGLNKWTSPDMEGLLDFLSKLREISDLSLSPLVIDLQQSFLEFNRLREELNKLDQSSRAVIDAQKELTDAQNYLYNQTKAQLLGIDVSAADAIRNLAGFQKGMQDVSETAKVGLESALQAAENRLKALERAATNLPNSGMGGAGVAGPQDPGADPSVIVRLFSGFVDSIDDEKTRLKAAIEEYKKQLSEVPKALTDLEVKLGVYNVFKSLGLDKLPQFAGLVVEMEKEKVRLQFEQLRLQIVGLGLWQEWEGAWQALYNQAMAEAGKSPTAGGRGGRGGSSDKQGVRDFIKDTKFELSLVGLTEYQKQLKELDRQYDDLIKQAGKDKKLKEELLALKEKELQLLKEEQKAATRDKFREFMGLVTPFDKVRKTAADLIKEINGSPLGNAQKGRMVGQVLAEIDRQVTRMSKEMAVNLFGQMLADMERFGATEEQMAGARQAMALLEHEMKMYDYRMSIEMLKAEGKLSADVIKRLEDGYKFLEGIDPTKFVGPSQPPANDNDNIAGGSYSSTVDLFNEFENRLKSVQDKIAEWNRIPLSENLAKATELTDSYAALLEDINKILPVQAGYSDLPIKAKQAYDKVVRGFIDSALNEFKDAGSELENQLVAVGDRFKDLNAAFVHLGATQEDLLNLEKARLSEVQKVLSQYLDPIKQYRLGRLIGERSTLTGEQQFYESQRQFREMFAKIQSGDLSQLGDVTTLAQQYEDLMRSFTGGEGLRFGLKEIDDALLSIENLVPGFASQIAEMGTSGNPMVVDNTAMIEAIENNEKSVNTGNELLLVEIRQAVKEMKDQNSHLSNLEVALQKIDVSTAA